MAKANTEAQKWPTNKDGYDRNYQKLFDGQCPTCRGSGTVWSNRIL